MPVVREVSQVRLRAHRESFATLKPGMALRMRVGRPTDQLKDHSLVKSHLC